MKTANQVYSFVFMDETPLMLLRKKPGVMSTAYFVLTMQASFPWQGCMTFGFCLILSTIFLFLLIRHIGSHNSVNLHFCILNAFIILMFVLDCLFCFSSGYLLNYQYLILRRSSENNTKEYNKRYAPCNKRNTCSPRMLFCSICTNLAAKLILLTKS